MSGYLKPIKAIEVIRQDSIVTKQPIHVTNVSFASLSPSLWSSYGISTKTYILRSNILQCTLFQDISQHGSNLRHSFNILLQCGRTSDLTHQDGSGHLFSRPLSRHFSSNFAARTNNYAEFFSIRVFKLILTSDFRLS